MHKWRISCSGNQNLFIFLLGLLRIYYRWKIFWGLIVYMYIMKLFEIIISTNIMIKFKQTHLLSFNYFPRKWSTCSCRTSVYMKKYINLIFSPLLLKLVLFLLRKPPTVLKEKLPTVVSLFWLDLKNLQHRCTYLKIISTLHMWQGKDILCEIGVMEQVWWT